VLIPEIVGYAAATMTTLAYAPQLVRVLRTREVAAISAAMYAVMSAGVALWLAYGLLIGSMPVIVANALTLAFALAILAMKVAGTKL